MNALPLWVQYVQAFSIPALAIVGALIAYRQWRTASNALRLNLFDRRFDVYVEAVTFIGNVMRQGYPENEHFSPFLRARDRAQFLFGPEVVSCLKEINDTAAALLATHRQIEGGRGGAARQKAADQNQSLLTKFTEFDARLVQLMAPYLAFSMVREKR
ncbi:hypothetical protein [Taklimakanibacter deserti]|uniref:hypothetical protein n=1 Tax=Taklimakanibacter deserti TaxID=2267839 RepID=UPI000E65294B